jgi:hypothetical protein
MAVRDLAPGRIQRYWVLMESKRYPIRKVLAAVTDMPAIALTSQDAFRVLGRFGFCVDTEE